MLPLESNATIRSKKHIYVTMVNRKGNTNRRWLEACYEACMLPGCYTNSQTSPIGTLFGGGIR